MVSALKYNGTFLLNCPYEDVAGLEASVPHRMLK
jgi:hypothetical protein